MFLPLSYRRALKNRDFIVLWLGSTVSLVGDGMTLVALVWLVLAQPGGAGRLSLLTVCYTLPVFAGGMMVGPLLDRFDKRHVLAADSVLRSIAMASIPLTAAVGQVPTALPFMVAAVYGLLRMVPLAGFPAAIPDLVASEELDAANALESMGFGVSGMVGPALGGLLAAGVGAANVLAFDAASFALFAVAAVAVRRPLMPDARVEADADTDGPEAAREGLSVLLHDRFLVLTTIAFMAFNIAEGMLLVVGPWLVKTQLSGGPGTLGLLLAALSAGGLIGGAFAGSRRPAGHPLTAIATTQVIASTGFLLVLAVPHPIGIAAGFFVIGLFSEPMTVWAQSARMERIPRHLRGRAFAALRTLMQGTPPIGAALAAVVVHPGGLGLGAFMMTTIAATPALVLLARRATWMAPKRYHAVSDHVAGSRLPAPVTPASGEALSELPKADEQSRR